MDLSRKTRWAIIIIIAILAVIIAYYIYSSNSSEMGVFLNNLKQAKEVALVMDTRGSPSLEVNHKIMTCGIGISGGNVLVGKDTTIYGLEEGGCVISYPDDTHNANATIEKCENEIKQKLQIYIRPGNIDKTTFEPNKMYLDISESFNDTCNLQIQ